MNLYFDHAATTPPRPEAIEALTRWIDAANASATHAAGRAARTAVEQSREEIAELLGASPHEIVFTSGGTEADNLIVKGVVWAALQQVTRPHAVTTAVEHAAVLEPLRWLAGRGELDLTVVDVEPDGRVDPERVLAEVGDSTVLVSVMAANNEIGAVNDIEALGAMLAGHPCVVHSDAVQMVATRPIDVGQLGVDALSLSAHKFGGPQGVGVAYLRRDMPIEPLSHGGGQDRGVRSGTFAAGLIAACGAALRAAARDRETLHDRLSGYADVIDERLTAVDGVVRTGPTDPRHRLASHTHLMIEGVAPDALGLALDREGVAASGGSACGSGATKASHVLAAIGAVGTPLRLTTGWTTTASEVDEVCDRVTEIVAGARASHRDTSAFNLSPVR